MFHKISLTFMVLLLAAASVQAQALGLENPARNNAMAPGLKTLPDGSGAILNWIEKDGEYHVLKLSLYDDSRFGQVREVAHGRDWFANWADTPAVHVRTDSTWIAHWLEKSADSTHAYGVRFAHSSDRGRIWSEARTPHGDNTPTEHGFVSYISPPTTSVPESSGWTAVKRAMGTKTTTTVGS